MTEPERELELVPNQDKLFEPVHKTVAEYEEFRREFREKVKPGLDRDREARRKSEEAARHHFVH